MSEHLTTTRRPEPDDVFLLTEHLLARQPDHSRSMSHTEYDLPDPRQLPPTPDLNLDSTAASVGHPDENGMSSVASPLSNLIGHLVYGRVISEEHAKRVSPGFAAYLHVLAETEKNAYERDIGGGTISRVYFFGKVLGSTSLTSPAISLSAAFRFPDEDWRKAVDQSWALIPEAYKSSAAFKGPDIMLLITNTKAKS